MKVTGKDVPMPYAANLEKLALPNVDDVVAAAKAVKQDDWPGAGERIPRQRRQGPDVTPEPAGERALRNPASEKQRAGIMAGGARQQARRDSKRASAR